MKVPTADTDTLLINFDVPVAERRISTRTLPDVDAQDIRAITIEHASQRADARTSHTNKSLHDECPPPGRDR
jgi:hypothetical protein